jgi:hypothetical protein
MAIEISYGDLKLVDSGTLVCSSDKEILIKIEDVSIKIIFQIDKNIPSYKQDYETENGIRVLKLTNYINSQGIGFKKMWDLGNGYHFDYMIIGHPQNQEGYAMRYMHYSIFKSK